MSLDIFQRLPRYGIVRNWLGSDVVAQLLDYVQRNAHALRETETEVSVDRQSKVDHQVRRSRRLPGLGELTAHVESRLHHVLPDIFAQLGTVAFVPTLEIELVAHGDGAFFTRHIDTYTRGRRQDRVISGVYYFHRQPKGFTGGELRLYPLTQASGPEAFVDVQPDNDTLAFFPSWFPHEVLPVRCASGLLEDSRFAINCWLLKG